MARDYGSRHTRAEEAQKIPLKKWAGFSFPRRAGVGASGAGVWGRCCTGSAAAFVCRTALRVYIAKR